MYRVPLIVVAALVGAACTLSPEDPEAPVGMHESTLGMIKLERAAPTTPEMAEGRAMFEAAFARYRGLEGHQVVSLLGGRTVENGQCVLGSFEEEAFDSPDAQVELLDVGDIEIRVADSRSQVVPRMFPDLAGLVGGHIYAEDVDLGAARADQDEYFLQAGGGEAAGFDLVAVAPVGFSQVHIDGYPSFEGAPLDRSLGVDVAWDAGDTLDEVEIDVIGGGEVVHCRGADDGAFHISPENLSELPSDEDARMVIRRVRWQLLDSVEFESAWLTLATSATLRVSLR